MGKCNDCPSNADGPYSDEYCTPCFERGVAEGKIDPEDHCDYYDKSYNKAAYDYGELDDADD